MTASCVSSSPWLPRSVRLVPDDILPYLMATRYCESDILFPEAFRLFGNVPPGTPVGDRWVQQNPALAVLIGVTAILIIFVPLSIRRFSEVTSR